jgi:lipopolysaccharide transport protein LptA
MKIFWSILLTAFGGAAIAQTNLPSFSASGNKIYVLSDSAEFDLKTRIAVYRGNVRVDDPQMKLTCHVLTAKLPERGGRIENIVAETNVVIDVVDENKRTNHATGDKLVYTYKVENAETNEVAKLTGNPRVDSPDGWLTGDVITWDFTRKKMFAEGNFHSGPHDTNSTNQPFIGIETPK